jgi:hypothetical protein
MNKSRLLGSICACIFAVISIPAEAVVIDFEGFLPDDSAYIASPQDWDGFRFESVGPSFGTYTDGSIDPAQLASNGTTRLGVFGDSSQRDSMMLSRIDGEGFILNSFDTAFRVDCCGTGNAGLDVLVTTVLGPSFLHHYALATTWQTITLPTYSLEMESILFTQTGQNLWGFAVDNVIINAVPIPAAVWLFGSGLVGLVAMSRRKKTA